MIKFVAEASVTRGGEELHEDNRKMVPIISESMREERKGKQDLLHWQQGNSRRVRERLTSYLHAHCRVHREDRATPHIILVSDSSVYSVSNLDLFILILSRKSQKTNTHIRFRFCHSLDSIIFSISSCWSLFLCVSSSRSFETSIYFALHAAR
jgi:hypothetical protein